MFGHASGAAARPASLAADPRLLPGFASTKQLLDLASNNIISASQVFLCANFWMFSACFLFFVFVFFGGAIKIEWGTGNKLK